MAVHVPAPVLAAASALILMLGVAPGAAPLTSDLGEDEIEFQDGAGNPVAVISPGETALFYVRDADLATVPAGVATWTSVGATVPENTWWSLATGEPDSAVFALSPDSLYDRAHPDLTPLHSVPSVSVDDVPHLIGDFVPNTGEVLMVFEVNSGSTLGVTFVFDVVDRYTPEQHRVRVTSDSDDGGVWAYMEEVISAADAGASPTSGIFRGEVALTPDMSAIGDGAVRVQPGDVLTGTYYESDGETVIDTHRVEVVPAAATPLPAARPIALFAGAVALALGMRFASRPSSALRRRAG